MTAVELGLLEWLRDGVVPRPIGDTSDEVAEWCEGGDLELSLRRLQAERNAWHEALVTLQEKLAQFIELPFSQPEPVEGTFRGCTC